MKQVFEYLEAADSIVIAGHIRPDGDSIGSSLALYQYLKRKYPEKTVDLYLDKPSEVFSYLEGFDEISEDPSGKTYDLFVAIDASSKDRLEYVAELFNTAKNKICIDHHISNTRYADSNYVFPGLSSTAEAVYEMIWTQEKDSFSSEQDFVQWLGAGIVTAIYTGLVHDTGVFKYSSTSPRTLNIAAFLIGTGIPFYDIIDQSFYQKTYVQTQIMGRCMLESIRVMEGKVVFSVVSKATMEFYGIASGDLDGIIDQLRIIKGVEVAILVHETDVQEYKVSMRSNGIVDVQKVAVYFGGGGHVRAAGCTMKGSVYDVINNLTRLIEEQFQIKA